MWELHFFSWTEEILYPSYRPAVAAGSVARKQRRASQHHLACVWFWDHAGWVGANPVFLGWSEPSSCLVVGLGWTQFLVWLEDKVGWSGSISCLVWGCGLDSEYAHLLGEITTHTLAATIQHTRSTIHQFLTGAVRWAHHFTNSTILICSRDKQTNNWHAHFLSVYKHMQKSQKPVPWAHQFNNSTEAASRHTKSYILSNVNQVQALLTYTKFKAIQVTPCSSLT